MHQTGRFCEDFWLWRSVAFKPAFARTNTELRE